MIYDANDGAKGWSATKARAVEARATQPSVTETKPDVAVTTEQPAD